MEVLFICGGSGLFLFGMPCGRFIGSCTCSCKMKFGVVKKEGLK